MPETKQVEIKDVKPSIDKIQYNTVQSILNDVYEDEITVEHTDNINHDEQAVRLVLENGAWIEYRRNRDKIRKVVFESKDHDTIFEDEVVEYGIESYNDFESSVIELVRIYRGVSVLDLKKRVERLSNNLSVETRITSR